MKRYVADIRNDLQKTSSEAVQNELNRIYGLYVCGCITAIDAVKSMIDICER